MQLLCPFFIIGITELVQYNISSKPKLPNRRRQIAVLFEINGTLLLVIGDTYLGRNNSMQLKLP